MLVREAILRDADDSESTQIRKAFSQRALKVFKTLTPMSSRLTVVKLDELAVQHMMQGQSVKVCKIVEKYVAKLLSEFHHFLRMYDFINENPEEAIGPKDEVNQSMND